MSKNVLDNLFASKVRVKVLKFIFRNFPDSFKVRILARRIQESYPTTKKEVELLKSIGLVKRST